MAELAAVFCALCAVLGALGSATYLWRASLARARRIRGGLGDAAQTIPEGTAAGVRTIRGTLVVHDGPAPVTRFPYGMALMEEVTPGAETKRHAALSIDVGRQCDRELPAPDGSQREVREDDRPLERASSRDA